MLTIKDYMKCELNYKLCWKVICLSFKILLSVHNLSWWDQYILMLCKSVLQIYIPNFSRKSKSSQSAKEEKFNGLLSHTKKRERITRNVLIKKISTAIPNLQRFSFTHCCWCKSIILPQYTINFPLLDKIFVYIAKYFAVTV